MRRRRIVMNSSEINRCTWWDVITDPGTEMERRWPRGTFALDRHDARWSALNRYGYMTNDLRVEPHIEGAA